MQSLFSSYNMQVESAYIIRIAGHESSEVKAKRAAESCDKVGMPWQYWDAYNGLENPIRPPEHHSDVINLLKVTDHYLTRGEAACALSHISLWNRCAQLDQPIVILEHDAVMVNPYLQHAVFNSIAYLGGHEQVKQGWQVLPTPPHASEGPNYHFLCRAHAYAIDPAVAKNLLAHVIKYGICAPLDIIIRADVFPIHQAGLYAYDVRDEETTILSRPSEGRSTQRNDGLEK
jgi:hypothetical protein